MIGKNVVSKVPLTLSQVREVLSERKKGGELGFEQSSSLDYAEKFGKLELEDADGCMEDLKGVSGMDEETAIKLADVLPEHASQVRIIAQRNKVELDEGKVLEVLKICKKYKGVARKVEEKKGEKEGEGEKEGKEKKEKEKEEEKEGKEGKKEEKEKKE